MQEAHPELEQSSEQRHFFCNNLSGAKECNRLWAIAALQVLQAAARWLDFWSGEFVGDVECKALVAQAYPLFAESGFRSTRLRHCHARQLHIFVVLSFVMRGIAASEMLTQIKLRQKRGLLRGSLLALMILAASRLGFAEDSCDCNAALVTAIYQSRVERADQNATVDLAGYFSGLSYEDYKKLVSKAGGEVFGILGFRENLTEPEFGEIKKTLQEKLRPGSDAINSQTLLDRHADLSVLQKWSECKSECKPSPGINCWIKDTGYGSLVLYINYVVRPGEQSRMASLRLTNAENLLPEPAEFQLYPGITTRSVHLKDQNAPAEIKIEAAGTEQDFKIQPSLSMPGATPTPLVTPTPVPTSTPIPTPAASPKVTPTPTPGRTRRPEATTSASKTPRRNASKQATSSPNKTPRHKYHPNPEQ